MFHQSKQYRPFILQELRFQRKQIKNFMRQSKFYWQMSACTAALFVSKKEDGHMRRKVKTCIAGIMAAVGMIAGSLSPAEASSAPLVNGEFSYFNYVVPGDGGYYLLCGNLVGYWVGVKEHRALPLCGRPVDKKRDITEKQKTGGIAQKHGRGCVGNRGYG